MISAQNLSISIGGTAIVSTQTLTCEPGKLTGLTGPSGAGKTTLLHALGLLLPLTAGDLTINGRNMSQATDAQRRRFWQQHAAFVLQDYGLIDDENLAFNVNLAHRKGRKVTSDAALHAALERTGLAGRESELTSHLSGGEKQRLALARAIYKRATYLFVDEPTASLDAANRHHVIALLQEFAADGATVVISTHDNDLIGACDVLHSVVQPAAQV